MTIEIPGNEYDAPQQPEKPLRPFVVVQENDVNTPLPPEYPLVPVDSERGLLSVEDQEPVPEGTPLPPRPVTWRQFLQEQATAVFSASLLASLVSIGYPLDEKPTPEEIQTFKKRMDPIRDLGEEVSEAAERQKLINILDGVMTRPRDRGFEQETLRILEKAGVELSEEERKRLKLPATVRARFDTATRELETVLPDGTVHTETEPSDSSERGGPSDTPVEILPIDPVVIEEPIRTE